MNTVILMSLLALYHHPEVKVQEIVAPTGSYYSVRRNMTSSAQAANKSQGLKASGLVGTVKVNGVPLAGARIIVTNKNTGFTRNLTTNSKGSFSVPKLDPGTYRVQVEKESFKSFETEIEVRAGDVVDISNLLSMPEGPIPDEPPRQPPGQSKTAKPRSNSGVSQTPQKPLGEASKEQAIFATAIAFEVVEGSFADEVALKNWLKKEVDEKGRLLAMIIPGKRDKKSLLLLRPKPAGTKISYFVTSVGKPLSREEVEKRIQANSEATFAGLHRISGNSFLMVFYHEAK